MYIKTKSWINPLNFLFGVLFYNMLWLVINILNCDKNSLLVANDYKELVHTKKGCSFWTALYVTKISIHGMEENYKVGIAVAKGDSKMAITWEGHDASLFISFNILPYFHIADMPSFIIVMTWDSHSRRSKLILWWYPVYFKVLWSTKLNLTVICF